MSQLQNPEGQKVIHLKPEEMLAFLRDKMTLAQGNASNSIQKELDRIFEVLENYTKLQASQQAEIKLLKDEILRLQKLCKNNKIDPEPPKEKKPNRAQRRKAARDAKKAAKKKK